MLGHWTFQVALPVFRSAEVTGMFDLTEFTPGALPTITPKGKSI